MHVNVDTDGFVTYLYFIGQENSSRQSAASAENVTTRTHSAAQGIVPITKHFFILLHKKILIEKKPIQPKIKA